VSDKRMSMREAIAAYVQDGASVAIEGYTAGICFAAGHEILRQRRRELTLIRLAPDLIYDQLVAAGAARMLIFSYLGNPGLGMLHAIRRAVEHGMPRTLALEEYSHYGLIGRYIAGAARLPFYPLRSYVGTDLPRVNGQIQVVESPYGDGPVAVVPPITPDVAILHAQRADEGGDTQCWGVPGVQKEAAFAAKHVIVVVEEVVDQVVIRADPQRTLIPGLIVDAVVHEPFGAHPSYVQGYYDRDAAFYREWAERSRDPEWVGRWLDEWVYGVRDRAEYVRKLGSERLARLAPGVSPAPAVDYGRYP
jgi:glutaconate CoA-transferase, subunit A